MCPATFRRPLAPPREDSGLPRCWTGPIYRQRLYVRATSGRGRVSWRSVSLLGVAFSHRSGRRPTAGTARTEAGTGVRIGIRPDRNTSAPTEVRACTSSGVKIAMHGPTAHPDDPRTARPKAICSRAWIFFLPIFGLPVLRGNCSPAATYSALRCCGCAPSCGACVLVRLPPPLNSSPLLRAVETRAAHTQAHVSISPHTSVRGRDCGGCMGGQDVLHVLLSFSVFPSPAPARKPFLALPLLLPLLRLWGV